jgi:hypothetical protein
VRTDREGAVKFALSCDQIQRSYTATVAAILWKVELTTSPL